MFIIIISCSSMHACMIHFIITSIHIPLVHRDRKDSLYRFWINFMLNLTIIFLFNDFIYIFALFGAFWYHFSVFCLNVSRFSPFQLFLITVSLFVKAKFPFLFKQRIKHIKLLIFFCWMVHRLLSKGNYARISFHRYHNRIRILRQSNSLINYPSQRQIC